MPRHLINDVDTPGLYTQVSWRKHDEIPESTAPGHVQVATVNTEVGNLVADLFHRAEDLLATLQGTTTDDTVRDACAEWRTKFDSHRSELTGWYASHTAESLTELIKVLHKAKRQALGPEIEGPVPAAFHPSASQPLAPARTAGEGRATGSATPRSP